MPDTHHPVRDTNEPPEPQELADPRRWKALAVLSMAQFMLILDLTVVNVALPDLGADLGLSRTAFTWTVSAYGLVFGGLLLFGGRLADSFGTRPMILTGLSSSPSPRWPPAWRSTRPCYSAAASVRAPGPRCCPSRAGGHHHRLPRRGTQQGPERVASLGGVGFTAGVLIGGLLTSGPGWRWVFFINVPVGIVLVAAVRAVVPLRRHPDRATQRLDVLGAVTVTAATGSFIYGMINAGDEGWADLITLLAIAIAIVLYGLFVVVERTVRTPLMRLNLLSRRPIAAGAFLMLIAAGVLIADLFLGSQYLQHLRGLSALETGLFFLPPALALMIGAITAGRLVGRIGTRPVAVVALALVAIGNALLIGVSADGNVYAEALPGVVVFALGGGSLFVCATTTALGRVGLHEAG